MARKKPPTPHPFFLMRSLHTSLLLGLILATFLPCRAESETPFRTVDGYKGIWFDLGQRGEFGSKYSGGLGTYTAKHCPMAIYSKEANKTFFVYGGTTAADQRHLLAMLSYYDHATGKVPKPVIVHDKQGVDDPHDNPSIQIDGDGHLWVFVSGRGRKRPGIIYRSEKPWDIHSMKHVEDGEFTYPQPWWVPDQGFAMFFTKYTNGRELYVMQSNKTGEMQGKGYKLAGMGGHYQVSHAHGRHLITAFNMHPGGEVDKRTNLYFVQSHSGGKIWLDIHGNKLFPPLTDPKGPTLVRDYQSEGRLVYMKDIATDWLGQPVILYLTAASHEPGPKGDPRIWTIARWNGEKWEFHEITRSTHNYDMGSLYLGFDTWKVIAPTEAGPQKHGTGGEIAVWISTDEGKTWKKEKPLTTGSQSNHGYVRRPHNAHPDFYAFWADGNPDTLSESRLYFTNRDGSNVHLLPYDMNEAEATPTLLPSN